MPKAHLDPTASGGEIKSSGAAPGGAAPDGTTPTPQAVTRSGFVALIGRPNVGKSTLLNHILGEKLAIVSPKPQTTRTRLLGIKNLPGAQLALVDTPGMHRPDGRGRTLLNRYMVDEALGALTDVDVVLLMTDLDTQRAQKAAPPDPEPQGGGEPIDEATRAVRALLHPADRYVVQQLGNCGKPLILAINKVDLLRDKKLLLPLIAEWNTLQNFRAIVPICAERGDGVDQLIEVLCATVPAGAALFPEDMLTDRAERFLVAELVREQVFLAAREELPYSVAVTIDGWEERIAPTGHRAGERIGVIIDATVHVEKANQKKIIVGEGGHMVRDLGIAARQAISELLGCGVHLSLFVRVDEEWTATPGGLRKMGYEAPNILAPAAGTNRRPAARSTAPKGPSLAQRADELQSPLPPRAAAPKPAPAQRHDGPRAKSASAQRRDDHKTKGGSAQRTDDPRAKDPASNRTDDRKSKGSPSHRPDDAKGRGFSSQRADDRKSHGSSQRADDRKSKGAASHRADDGKAKGSSSPRSDDRASFQRADDRKSSGSAATKSKVASPRNAKTKGAPPERTADTKFKGARPSERAAKAKGPRPTPPSRGGPPRPSSHTSHAGPGEHAK